MRAAQVLMQYLHDLAGQHGEIMALALRLNQLISRSESAVARIL
jgi:hypothetical protein